MNVTELTILVRKSKTDQAGVGSFVFLGNLPDMKQWCPVTALNQLASFWPNPRPLIGNVFTRAVHHEHRVPAATMGSRLKRRLAELGAHENQLYSLHSFRSGGATAAVRAQLPRRIIEGHGHWQSSAGEVYIRDVESELYGRSIQSMGSNPMSSGHGSGDPP